MAPVDVLLVICLAIGLVGLILALVSWRTGMGTGRILEGIALILLAAGLYLSGLMQLVYDLLVAVVDWAQTTQWDIPHVVGVVLLAVGILAWIVAGSFNRRGVGVLTSEERRVRRDERLQAKQARKADKQGGDQAQVGRGASGTATGRGTGAGTAAPGGGATPGPGQPGGGSDPAAQDDFDEIEAILKKRGIN